MKHSLKWFTDRIGKRIYRKQLTCRCKKCEDVTHNGVVIKNENHAQYLWTISTDILFVYSDKPYKK